MSVGPIAIKNVAEGRTVLARSDFIAARVTTVAVERSRLWVKADYPPPRHALIVGWPGPEDDMVRKNLAMQFRNEVRPTLERRT